MTDNTYNGWTNYETWNVALWIENDEGLYSLAQEWKEDRWDSSYDSADYDTFRHTLTELFGDATPDGVRWNDPKLDHEELDEMLAEI